MVSNCNQSKRVLFIVEERGVFKMSSSNIDNEMDSKIHLAPKESYVEQVISIFEPMQNSIKQISELAWPIIISAQKIEEHIGKIFKESVEPHLKSITDFMSGITHFVQDLYSNPENLFSFFGYMKNLNSFYWSLPFEMDGTTLRNIIEKSIDEKSFDLNMSRYFSKKKTDELFLQTYDLLPRSKKRLFKQIHETFNNKCFLLVNGPLISLIDDMLGLLLKSRANTARSGILLPILDDLNDSVDGFAYVYLNILSNNIDCIFSGIDLNEKVNISNNKKIRRHAIQHGRFFGSNRRIESIMLVNTLYNTLIILSNLKGYHGKLYYNRGKKGFVIDRQKLI